MHERTTTRGVEAAQHDLYSPSGGPVPPSVGCTRTIPTNDYPSSTNPGLIPVSSLAERRYFVVLHVFAMVYWVLRYAIH